MAQKKPRALSPASEGKLKELAGLSCVWLVGIDEVGVGCLAGPVIAAAFAYPLSSAAELKKCIKTHKARFTDSKILNAEARAKSVACIEKARDCVWEIGRAEVEEIDRLNIYHAAHLAMRRALGGVLARIPAEVCHETLVLVDGNRVPKFFEEDGFPPARALVKGDGRAFAIAAASILAKEHRDALMMKLACEFPGYGWERNVGYGTPEHLAGLRALGLSPWHRLSFSPCGNLANDGVSP